MAWSLVNSATLKRKKRGEQEKRKDKVDACYEHVVSYVVVPKYFGPSIVSYSIL